MRAGRRCHRCPTLAAHTLVRLSLPTDPDSGRGSISLKRSRPFSLCLGSTAGVCSRAPADAQSLLQQDVGASLLQQDVAATRLDAAPSLLLPHTSWPPKRQGGHRPGARRHRGPTPLAPCRAVRCERLGALGGRLRCGGAAHHNNSAANVAGNRDAGGSGCRLAWVWGRREALQGHMPRSARRPRWRTSHGGETARRHRHHDASPLTGAWHDTRRRDDGGGARRLLLRGQHAAWRRMHAGDDVVGGRAPQSKERCCPRFPLHPGPSVAQRASLAEDKRNEHVDSERGRLGGVV
mmetsp:Transcript_40179/g.92951  ORF Transcript_40179/g.92951 Transcript_40179/m.92951 type:complete len:293 (-) Transcript_40179:14-892(-)